MPLANANAANAPGWSSPLLLFLSTTSFFPLLLSLYWFHQWRIIVGIIRRTFNLELIRPQLPFPFPLRLAFKPNEILQKAAKKKKTWRGKWRKIPNKLRATKSKNFFLTRKRKTSLSRSGFFLLSFSLAFLSILLLLFAYFSGRTWSWYSNSVDHLSFSYAKSFPKGCERWGREAKGREGCYALMRIFMALALAQTHAHTEAVYYDYYLCGLNPQLLKRSLKFNIHLHFGQKTFQALIRESEKEGRQREREGRQTPSLRAITICGQFRLQAQPEGRSQKPTRSSRPSPHNLLLLSLLLCTVKQKHQIRRHKSAWKQVEQSESLTLKLLPKLRFHFQRNRKFPFYKTFARYFGMQKIISTLLHSLLILAILLSNLSKNLIIIASN